MCITSIEKNANHSHNMLFSQIMTHTVTDLANTLQNCKAFRYQPLLPIHLLSMKPVTLLGKRSTEERVPEEGAGVADGPGSHTKPDS